MKKLSFLVFVCLIAFLTSCNEDRQAPSPAEQQSLSARILPVSQFPTGFSDRLNSAAQCGNKGSVDWKQIERDGGVTMEKTVKHISFYVPLADGDGFILRFASDGSTSHEIGVLPKSATCYQCSGGSGCTITVKLKEDSITCSGDGCTLRVWAC